MSLQVQSSQPAAAPSGRRTPQVYQNLTANPAPAPASSATPPTNGNSSAKSSSGKLSLKGSSGKSSPASSGKSSPAPVKPEVTVTPPTPVQAKPVEAAVVAPTPPKVVVVDLVNDDNDKPTSPAKIPAAVTKEVTNGSAKDTNGKQEEVVVKESPKKATPQKSIPVEQVKTPETVSPKKPQPAPEPAKKKVDNSLVAEKTLKGFTAEGDEMESLVVEPSEYEDSPMPPRTGGKAKLLKGGPPTRARISPFRIAQEAVASLVNLSTVSEGQNAESSDTSPVDFNRPLRAISGRRSTRPLTEIQFSYRKPTVELNDSSSSLNVTVGSEIHNDSLRTPAGPSSTRKRKAMTPESTSDALDVKEHTTDSPKRTRLDFSGFLGIVASPVTMLKNRFSRVRLHASTPVAKRSFDSEEDLGKCVTAEATTTTANISGGGDDEAKMDVEPAAETDKKEPEVDVTPKEGQTDLPADQDAAAASKDASNAEEAKEDSVEVKDVTDKQRRCVIM